MITLNISVNILKMENQIHNKEEIREYLKIVLENMYMFGGMPRPDPKYDSYMNTQIEILMKIIEKK